MKIIIKGADFKDNNLESTTISKYYSVTYSGSGVSSSSAPKTIAYGDDNYAVQDLVATIKVLSSYTFNSVTSVSVGGKALSTSDYTVSGQIVTVPANKINGNVVIVVSATAVNTGGGSGDSEGGTLITSGSLAGAKYYENGHFNGSSYGTTEDGSIIVIPDETTNYIFLEYIPVEPDTLYKMTLARDTIFVDADKNKLTRFNIKTQSSEYEFTTPKNCAYMSTCVSKDDLGSNDYTILTLEKLIKTIKSTTYLKDTTAIYRVGGITTGYEDTTTEGWISYKEIPITPGTTYAIPYARNSWYLDGDKNALTSNASINLTSGATNFMFTAPDNAAYISCAFKASEDKWPDGTAISQDNLTIIEYNE